MHAVHVEASRFQFAVNIYCCGDRGVKFILGLRLYRALLAHYLLTCLNAFSGGLSRSFPLTIGQNLGSCVMLTSKLSPLINPARKVSTRPASILNLQTAATYKSRVSLRLSFSPRHSTHHFRLWGFKSPMSTSIHYQALQLPDHAAITAAANKRPSPPTSQLA